MSECEICHWHQRTRRISIDTYAPNDIATHIPDGREEVRPGAICIIEAYWVCDQCYEKIRQGDWKKCTTCKRRPVSYHVLMGSYYMDLCNTCISVARGLSQNFVDTVVRGRSPHNYDCSICGRDVRTGGRSDATSAICNRCLGIDNNQSRQSNNVYGDIEIKNDELYIWDPSKLILVREPHDLTRIDIETTGSIEGHTSNVGNLLKHAFIKDGSVIWIAKDVRIVECSINNNIDYDMSYRNYGQYQTTMKLDIKYLSIKPVNQIQRQQTPDLSQQYTNQHGQLHVQCSCGFTDFTSQYTEAYLHAGGVACPMSCLSGPGSHCYIIIAPGHEIMFRAPIERTHLLGRENVSRVQLDESGLPSNRVFTERQIVPHQGERVNVRPRRRGNILMVRCECGHREEIPPTTRVYNHAGTNVAMAPFFGQMRSEYPLIPGHNLVFEIIRADDAELEDLR